MKRDDVLRVLGERRSELSRRFGVKSLALFGSVARGQDTASSDIDILVDFDHPISLFELVALEQHLEEVLGAEHVDVVPRDCVYPELEASIVEGAIRVE
jgi:hypothetical protein